jgi:hypothetical protein
MAERKRTKQKTNNGPHITAEKKKLHYTINAVVI